jgi:hypothetical protein
MKSIHRIGLGAVVTVASAAVWLACSNDDTSTPPNPDSGAMDVTTAVDSGTEQDTGMMMMADSGTPPPQDSGMAQETGPAAVSCSNYCSVVMTNCTGANKQYLDMGECMTACALLPLGTATDSSGNTVGCRTIHAGYAAAMGAVPHCWHAGPFGYGGCGNECEGFCTLATKFCSPDGGFDGGPAAYASVSDCMTSCAGYAKIDDPDGGGAGALGVDGGYNAAGPTSGNTLDCREWHLDNALDMPGSNAGQNLHCNHVGMTGGGAGLCGN